MPQRADVSTRKGLFELEHGAGGWQRGPVHILGEPVSMALHDRRDGSVYAALNLGHFGVKLLWAGTLPGGLFRSADGGVHWQEITTAPVSHFGFAVAADPTDGGAAFAAGGGAVPCLTSGIAGWGRAWRARHRPDRDAGRSAWSMLARRRAAAVKTLSETHRQRARALRAGAALAVICSAYMPHHHNKFSAMGRGQYI